jgi:hypothetical protein
MSADDRTTLAELIRKAGWDAQDSPDYEKCGFDSDLFTADAILARYHLVPKVIEAPADWPATRALVCPCEGCK